ncbi:MAG TPA: hypothetical protein VKE70_10000 [Candidatus Solibacter sp.]|nr:hypothetical protein [Candidatus Solibacter sp.]
MSLAVAASSFAQEVASPPQGWLVLHGGWILSPVMTQKFAALAGLPDSPVIVIPTAEVPNNMTAKDAERA